MRPCSLKAARPQCPFTRPGVCARVPAAQPSRPRPGFLPCSAPERTSGSSAGLSISPPPTLVCRWSPSALYMVLRYFSSSSFHFARRCRRLSASLSLPVLPGHPCPACCRSATSSWPRRCQRFYQYRDRGAFVALVQFPFAVLCKRSYDLWDPVKSCIGVDLNKQKRDRNGSGVYPRISLMWY